MITRTLARVLALRGVPPSALSSGTTRCFSTLEQFTDQELDAALKQRALDREVRYDFRAAGGFCAKAWDACAHQREVIHQLPLVCELAEGSLSRDRFQEVGKPDQITYGRTQRTDARTRAH